MSVATEYKIYLLPNNYPGYESNDKIQPRKVVHITSLLPIIFDMTGISLKVGIPQFLGIHRYLLCVALVYAAHFYFMVNSYSNVERIIEKEDFKNCTIVTTKIWAREMQKKLPYEFNVLNNEQNENSVELKITGRKEPFFPFYYESLA